MKRVFAQILFILITSGFAVTASADGVTYSYAGNHFTSFDSPYNSTMSVSVSFTLDNALGDGSYNNVSVLPGFSYTFNDGLRTFTSPGIIPSFFQISLSGGSVVSWNINLQPELEQQGGGSITTRKGLSGVYDSAVQFLPGGASGAIVLSNPGAWTVPVPAVPAVPEPETYAMMLAGLGLIGFIARRRKQKLAA